MQNSVRSWVGSVSRESQRGAPLLSSMWMKCVLLNHYEHWIASTSVRMDSVLYDSYAILFSGLLTSLLA